MRKILAGFLATSMIVAVASSVTFAANASLDFTVTDAKINPVLTAKDSAAKIDTVTGTMDATVTVNALRVQVTTANGVDSFEIPIGETLRPVTLKFAASSPVDEKVSLAADAVVLSLSDVRDMLAGKKFSSVQIGNKLYSGRTEKLSATNPSNGLRIAFDDATMPVITAADATLMVSVSYSPSADFKLSDSNTAKSDYEYYVSKDGLSKGSTLSFTAINNASSHKDLSDVETSGSMKDVTKLEDVIICDGDGRPVPMTEKAAGVDKDQNGENGVQSGTTLYFMINDDGGVTDRKGVDMSKTFADDTYWKLKVTKGDNGKLIKAITDTTKTFSTPLQNAYYGNAITGIDFTKRHRYIKVELNEVYTDDEYKLTLDARLSAQTKAAEKFDIDDDTEIKVKDFYFYMKNIVKTADNDWKVGVGGLMLNPLENDWNEVTYFDEDGDLAFMKFFADSDVGKFYAKLSTKWEHADYASYFNDQDAFIFNFTGSPKLSSTSRADLEIYNPFVDEDGNETIDPTTAVVYQVIDGDLYDVTDSFEYKEGDNGDMAFITRTRFLGTYIICEKAVEEAVADETVPDELTPDTDTGAPEETTPDNSNSGKTPANTGKYL